MIWSIDSPVKQTLGGEFLYVSGGFPKRNS